MRTFKRVKVRSSTDDLTKLRKGVNCILVNLTPHPINICDSKKNVIAIIPSDETKRIDTKLERIAEFELDLNDCIPIYKITSVTVDDMPPPIKSTFYIVSNVMAEALKRNGRFADILVPYRPIKNINNKVIGCAGFTCLG